MRSSRCRCHFFQTNRADVFVLSLVCFLYSSSSHISAPDVGQEIGGTRVAVEPTIFFCNTYVWTERKPAPKRAVLLLFLVLFCIFVLFYFFLVGIISFAVSCAASCVKSTWLLCCCCCCSFFIDTMRAEPLSDSLAAGFLTNGTARVVGKLGVFRLRVRRICPSPPSPRPLSSLLPDALCLLPPHPLRCLLAIFPLAMSYPGFISVGQACLWMRARRGGVEKKREGKGDGARKVSLPP